MGEPGNPESNPHQEYGKTARPGDYKRALDRSCFRESTVLAKAVPFIEKGQFEKCYDVVLRAIKKRGIKLEFLDPQEMIRGTKKNGEIEIMVLPTNFNSQHPAKKTWSLLHRNMSLILQRIGERSNPRLLKELVLMDIAYAQSTRLGARYLKPEEEKEVLSLSGAIELQARKSLSSLIS